MIELLGKSLGMNYASVKETDPEWQDQDTRECITFNQSERDKERPKPGNYLKVPFKEALSLVARRQVFISKGIAYVPVKELTSIASAHFRARLASELVKAYRFLPSIIKDQRLQQMLMGLSNHNAIDFNIFEPKAPSGDDKIRLSELDFYSRKSFPPCMKTLYTALRKEHHLKHFGRLQLSLYLKGIGLTMEESLQFWKTEFTRKHDIDSEKFEKNYAYNIRHSYGQEGKRNDYKPWNCSKIINLAAPSNGEYHGCPFKTFSDDNMINLLSSYGITKEEIRVIMDKKQDNLH